jgi:hypothetical protein
VTFIFDVAHHTPGKTPLSTSFMIGPVPRVSRSGLRADRQASTRSCNCGPDDLCCAQALLVRKFERLAVAATACR